MSEGLGLAAYRKRKAEEEARRAEASKPKIQRFNLEKDGDSAIIRFLQEIDYDANNYDTERGIGFVNLEHVNGDDPKSGWLTNANCSEETQGACYPCERAKDYSVDWNARKGWKQKEKFYINLVGGTPREVVVSEGGKDKTKYFTTDIDRASGDGTVYLLSQSTHNGIYDALADYFLEEEVSGGSITDKYFKITRKGSGFNDTSYGVVALKEIPADAKDISEFELYNIKEDVLREVDYAQQEAFYLGGNARQAVVEQQPVAAAASAASDEW